ncbi:hypothetical protein H5410_046426 [Solanum commersonii]|uniref:Uncharacterized protein n=1 Tax=Solanum commersonii TaxID=4109 RepID=A0A9J5XGG0_SOLCO|nr:hypothetical protein H5410_046426 [Solanum commersonii]
MENGTRTGIEEKVVVEYDQYHLVSVRAQDFYYAYLIKKKFLKGERHCTLQREEMLLNFCQRLEHSSLICFAPEPFKVNEQWVRELYDNLIETNKSTRLITI